MNKILFPLAVIITLSACSQGQAQRSARDENPSLDKFYDRFNAAGKEGSLSFDPGFMLNASFSGKKSDNSSWIHKVTHVRLLILSDKKTKAQQEEWKELPRLLQEDRFEDLLTIRQGQDRVQLLSKERSDGEKDIVFWTGDKDGGGLLIHFRGPFTARDMEKIRESVQ
ncbi:MAG TPA: DUF4252 domain-containing protein [Puia sp.]|jgi:hypothetical protein|nr:DUF4252 domain-containing protein [Puia sp.]